MKNFVLFCSCLYLLSQVIAWWILFLQADFPQDGFGVLGVTIIWSFFFLIPGIPLALFMLYYALKSRK